MRTLLMILSISFSLVITVVAAKKTIFHKIDTSICTQCGECIQGCPVQAIKAVKRDGKLIHEIDPSLCTQCGLCIENCEVEAIKIIEKELEPKKVSSKVVEKQ